MRPNENISSDLLFFASWPGELINLGFACIGDLDRTVAVSAI